MIATQKVRTNIYLDQETKIQAKELFKKFHISLSDAVNLFLSQSVLEQGLPFAVKIPNATTRKAMQEVDENKNMEELSLKGFIKELDTLRGA